MSQFVWKFSPSIMETYFSRNSCLRGLVTAGLDNHSRSVFGFAEEEFQQKNSVSNAGNKWEKDALDLLRIHGADCVFKNEKDENKKMPEDEVVAHLEYLFQNREKLSFPRYLYQVGLKIENSFLKKHIKSISEAQLNIILDGIKKNSLSYPDLVRVDRDDNEPERLKLSIVDIKLAKKPKVEHKMQIAMYIYLLEDFVARHKLDKICFVNTQEGFLFNYGQQEEQSFETKRVFYFFDHFLNEKIPEIFSIVNKCKVDKNLQSHFPYHFGQKCGWCPNYKLCIEGCIDKHEEMMLLPYLSPYCQDYLRSVITKYSCDEVKKFCATEEGKKLLSEKKFFKRFLKSYSDNLDMLKQGCEIFKGKSNKHEYRQRDIALREMPYSEDVQIVLTAQKDEGYDQCYLWGLNVSTKTNCTYKPNIDKFLKNSYEGISLKCKKDEKGKGFFSCTIVVKDMEKYQDKAAELFIQIWHSVLKEVSDKNKEIDGSDKTQDKDVRISLQHYVMDNYELANITETLFNAIDNKNIASLATDILLILQGKQLAESDIKDRPEKTVDYPVIILTTAINKLFAIPAFISLGIVDVCKAFTTDLDKVINNSKFINKQSNVLKNDKINKYWEKHVEKDLEDIEQYVSNRLYAEKVIIKEIRDTQHPGISKRVKLAPFYMLESEKYKIPEVSKLSFETLYELQLAYIEAQKIRSNVNDAVQENKIWKLEYKDREKIPDKNDKRKFTWKCSFSLRENLNKDSLYSAIICKNTPDNEKAIPFYQDNLDNSKNNQRFYPLVKFYEYNYYNLEINGKTVFISGIPTKCFNEWMVWSNKEFYMFEHVTTENLKWNQTAFSLVDNSEKSYILEPYNSNHKFVGCNFEEIKEDILNYGRIGKENFTESQKKALKHLYENSITLLQGPPGTGKTDFIARAIISLSRFYYEKKKNLNILVSANSHAAIENVLVKVSEMMKKMSLSEKDIFVSKVSHVERDLPKINIFTKTDFKKKSGREKIPCVIGSTLWQIPKIFYGKDKNEIKTQFDLVILDEASQVRMADAIIPFLCSSKETTRFLIVGDENQLPPIIAGKYEKTSDKPFLFGSVFRYYHDCDRLYNSKENSYEVSLLENFRSNSAIFDYSAQSIYGTDYKAFNEQIGLQSLKNVIGSSENIKAMLKNMSPKDSDNKLIAQIIDPDYPLVLCRLKETDVSKCIERETELVAKITKTYQYIFSKVKKNYTAKEFWQGDGAGKCGDFGIVSPHHEHIQRLKDKIVPENGEVWPLEETKDDLFIGTVDKLQGQEREVVVVSYGVSDIEQAVAEGEFIFSKNRLNVAITRAKKKCIVFLSDALLEYPMSALGESDQELLEGIDFVCGFGEYMEENDKKPIECNDMIVYRKEQS